MKKLRLKNEAAQEKLDKLTGFKFTSDLSGGRYRTGTNNFTGERVVYVETVVRNGSGADEPITITMNRDQFEDLPPVYDPSRNDGWNLYPCEGIPVLKDYKVIVLRRGKRPGDWGLDQIAIGTTDSVGGLLFANSSGSQYLANRWGDLDNGILSEPDEYKVLVKRWVTPDFNKIIGGEE